MSFCLPLSVSFPSPSVVRPKAYDVPCLPSTFSFPQEEDEIVNEEEEEKENEKEDKRKEKEREEEEDR